MANTSEQKQSLPQAGVSSESNVSGTSALIAAETQTGAAPVALDDAARVYQYDGANVIDVLANDADPEGGPLTITAVSDPEGGWAYVTEDQKIAYYPDWDVTDEDSFTYTVSDAEGNESSATVNVNVVRENISDTNLDLSGGGSLSLGLRTPERTEDGSLRVNGNVAAYREQGVEIQSLEIRLNGETVKVIPAAELNEMLLYSNIDSAYTFSTTVEGLSLEAGALNKLEAIVRAEIPGEGEGAPVAVQTSVYNIIQPEGQPDVAVAPVAVDDVVKAGVQNDVYFDVLRNDFDPDQTDYTLSNVTIEGALPGQGTVTSYGGGGFNFSPGSDFADLAPGESRDVTFNYTVTDKDGESAQAQVTVHVTNDVPDAVDDTAEAEVLTPVKIDVLANDTDVDNDKLYVGSTGTPAHGTTWLNSDGTVGYLADAGFSGTDVFSYEIYDADGNRDKAQISVNVAPSAQNEIYSDTSIALKQGGTLTLTLFTPEVSDAVNAYAHGTLVLQDTWATEPESVDIYVDGEKALTLTPADLTDLTGGTEGDYRPVRVFSFDVNSDELGSQFYDVGAKIEAVANVATRVPVWTIDPMPIDPLPVDPALVDPAPDQVQSLTKPALIDAPIRILPGEGGFTEEIVRESVSVYNVTTAAGGFAPDPEEGFVEAANFVPVSVADVVQVFADGETTFDVLKNDFDPDANDNELTLVSVDAPEQGTLVNHEDGTFTFTPGDSFQDLAPGETREVNFTYTVADADGAQTQGQVTVNVTGDYLYYRADEDAVIPGAAPGVNPQAVVADGGSWGDPHLVTLDGLSYDFQAAGEFILTQADARGFEVQTRQEPLNGFAVAVNTAAAVRSGGTVVMLDKDYPNSVFIDGKETALTEGQRLDLPEGGSVARAGAVFTVTGPQGDAAAVSVFEGSHIDVAVSVVSGEGVSGLLGDADGAAYDDLQLADGTSLTTVAMTDQAADPTGAVIIEGEPASWVGLNEDVLYGEYADAWRVTDENTLFTYGQGESREGFDDPSFPASAQGLEGFGEQEIAAARAAVAKTGVAQGPAFENLVIDYLASGGNEAFLQNAAALAQATQGAQVLDVDEAPNAVSDAALAVPGQATVIDVLANDSDPEGGALTLAEAGTAENGAVAVTEDGKVIYTSNAGFTGKDSFSYTVTDAAGNEDVAQVNVTVLPAFTSWADFSSLSLPVAVDVAERVASGDEIGEIALPGQVRHVVGGAGDDTIFGDSRDNRLRGGDGNDLLDGRAGKDDLRGGAGDDTLRGGAGDDHLRGGAGEDFALYDDQTASVFVDLEAGKATGEGAGADTLISVESVVGGGGNDVLLGSALGNHIGGGAGDDEIKGGAGDDVLTGGDGADRIDGGDGTDWLSGDAGDDVLDGGEGYDTAGYSGAAGVVTLDLEAGTATVINPLSRSVETDTLENVEAVTGGAYGDSLRGDAGNNRFDGGEGDDYLNGADGDDELTGGAGNDRLVGGAGSDLFNGGAGDDRISAQAGNDYILGGSGNDILRGGSGFDVVDYSGFEGVLRADLGLGTVEKSEGDALTVDRLSLIESLIGGESDDVLSGSRFRDELNGGGGADVLEGKGGADTFVFDSLTDSVTGAEDLIVDFSGADVLDFSALGFDGLGEFEVVRTDGYTYLNHLTDSFAVKFTGDIALGSDDIVWS